MSARKLLSVLAVLLVATLTSVIAVACPSEPIEPGPETGVYYYDVGGEDNLLSLYDGNKFTFKKGSEVKSGTYTVIDSAISLTYSGEKEASLTATYSDSARTVTFTEGNSAKVYLENKYFDVKFVDGEDQKVLNGKTVVKPADPVKEGYDFLGWYSDEACKTPYLFNGNTITEDVTVYARWALKSAQDEFYIDFDLGFESSMDGVYTRNGLLTDMPLPPVREGYSFVGWWRSDYEDGSKLTAKYEESYEFKANTTLFAVWETASDKALTVSVNSEAVSWTAERDVVKLIVTGPSGFIAVNADVNGRIKNVDFAAAPAGDYEITVICGEKTAKAFYKNKALDRVSLFRVEGSTVSYNGVEGAENYYITVRCGNSRHNHTELYNGKSLYYNFENCEMVNGGISFVVTAKANGYAPSVSEEFIVKRELASVSGFAVAAKTATLTWDEVANATGYVIGVGGKTVTLDKPQYSLKEFGKGEIKVEVYATAKGYVSSASEFTVIKANIASPSELKIVKQVISWKAVDGADNYTVKFGSTYYDVTETRFDMSEIEMYNGDEFVISVKANAAVAAESSIYSDELDARYMQLEESLEYSDNVVSWKHVIGAAFYEVKVNGDSPTRVEGDNKATVSLGKTGENVIKVRFYNGIRWSEYAELTVDAYMVMFNSNGGSAGETRFVAIGDTINIEEPTKEGCDFAGWYNTYDGADGCGGRYNGEAYSYSGNTVWYAYWTPKTYNVKVIKGEGEQVEVKIVYTEDYHIEPSEDRDDALFAGYFTAPDGFGTQLTDETGRSLAPWQFTDIDTVYAYYAKDLLTFTLREDGTYGVTKGKDIYKFNRVTVPAKYNGKDVTVISAYAFRYLYSLLEVNIPDSIEVIEVGTAFSGCTSLENINIYKTGKVGARYFSVDGVLFAHDDAGTEVSLFPQGKKGEFVVPDDIVRIPQKAFINITGLTNIIIPASVNYIGKSAFYGCTALENVVFLEAKDGQEANLVIDSYAFQKCRLLSEVNLPSHLTEFNSEAFTGCVNLQNINIANGNAKYSSVDGMVTNAAGNEIIYCPTAKSGAVRIPASVDSIGAEAFMYCDKLNEITFSSTISTIGTNAFYGCSSLRKITFEGSPDASETTIGESAFARCYALSNVVFQENSNVVNIGTQAFAFDFALASFVFDKATAVVESKAFSGCVSLASIEFAEGVEQINLAKDAFDECIALVRVKIPSTMTDIPVDAINERASIQSIEVDANNPYFSADGTTVYSSDKTILYFYSKNYVSDDGVADIDAKVEQISNGVFNGNRNVVSVNLSSALKRIGANAFANMPYLTSVTFATGGESELVIEESAFQGTSALGGIVIPSRATSIGSKAFKDSGVTSVVLGKNVTEIGDEAFMNTARMAEFTIENGSMLSVISESSFRASAIQSIIVPATVTKISANAFLGASALGSVTVAEGSALKEVGNGAFSASAIVSVSLPATVEILGTGIFENCKSLTSVSFADGMNVEVLPERTFAGCTAMTTYNVIAKITEIGKEAFKNCTSLANITFAVGGDKALTIGDGAFYGCTAIGTLALPSRLVSIGNESMVGSGIMSVTFTDKAAGGDNENSDLVSIGTRAFAGAKIQSITLPEGLQHIGLRAFEKSTLKSIVIPSTVNNIDKVFGFGAEEGAIDGKPCYVTATFSGCTSLETVEFKECSDASMGVSLNYDMFSGCTSLTKVILPKRLVGNVLIEAIGATTFRGCSSLSEIILSSDCENYAVEDGVLYKLGAAKEKETLVMCVAAKTGSVVVPASVKTISGGAFMNCSQVTSIEFEEGEGNSVPLTIANGSADMESNKVDYAPFYGTTFTGITLPNRLTRIGAYAFIGTKLTSIVVPSSVRDTADSFAIGEYAFYKLTSLTSVRFEGNEGEAGDARYSIGARAFYGCSGIAALEFGYGLKKVDEYAFINCSNAALTALNFPSTTKSLGIRSFAGCTGVKNINFAEGTYLDSGKINVSGLGNSCFLNIKLASFKFPEAVTYTRTASNNVFGPTNKTITEVTLPKGLAKAQNGILTGLKGLEKIVVEEGNAKYVAEDGILYEKNENGEKFKLICYPMAKKGASFVIPSSVTMVGDSVSWGGVGANYHIGGFIGNAKIQSVTVPASVKTIQQLAFYNCSNLSSVIFVDVAEGQTAAGLTIGGKAFGNCGSLSRVSFPSRLTSLGTSLFESSGIEEVDFGANCKLTRIPDYAFADTELVSIKIPKSVTAIGSGAFYSCMSLETFELEEGCVIEEIGDEAFNGCMNVVLDINELLANVTDMGQDVFWMNQRITCGTDGTLRLSDDIEEIPDYAFDGLSVIKKVIWPSNLNYIGECAFSRTGIEEVILPETVTFISYAAFSQCKSLKKVIIPSQASYDYNAFYKCTALEEVDIKTSLIAQSMFEGCTSLKKIKLYEGLERIEYGAFKGCTSLEEIVIPSSVKNLAKLSYVTNSAGVSIYGARGIAIEKNAFFGCVSLKKVEFVDGGMGNVTLGDSIFENCTSLETVILPDRMANAFFTNSKGTVEFAAIGSNAFKDCKMLANINIKSLSSMEGYGNNAFANTAITEAFIPAALRYYGTTPFAGCQISQIVVEEGNLTVIEKDGVLYDRAFSTLLLYPVAASLDVVIPATVEKIQSGAFAGSNIRSIKMPAIAIIDDGMFKNCAKLTSVTFGAMISAIGANAFEGCVGISEITIPKSVTSVGASAFAGWSNAQTIKIAGGAVPATWNEAWNANCEANIIMMA